MKKLILYAALLLAACGSEPTADGPLVADVGGADRSHAGTAMPEIEVVDPDGQPVLLADVAEGEPVLVNLWASWCAPCVKELPTLLALSRQQGSPMVLALSQDMAPQGSVRAFLEEHGVAELGAWQDAEMAMTDALPVSIMPTTILYDAEGKEVWRYVGDLDWSGEEAAELLSGLD